MDARHWYPSRGDRLSASYVLTGGNAEFVAALSSHLRAERIVESPEELRGDLTSWIHLLPDRSGSLAEIAERADEHVPRGGGACFTVVAPVWGAIKQDHDEKAELAGSSAEALMQSRLERWSAQNRRINVIRYVPIPEIVPPARSAETIVARTPMHRLPTINELADAIDFLASSAAAYITGSVVDVDGGWGAYSWFYPARVL
jgi:hypothetical protein